MNTLGSRLHGFALLSLMLALAAGCGSSPDDADAPASGQGDDEPPRMVGMTAAHNAARAAVDPPAEQPLPPLSWSSELAAVAQAHVAKCVFRHSANGYGENLFATSSGASPTPEDVVGSWISEAVSYDLASNACSGATCGHYTQVVWADSLRLGCGIASCADGSPFEGGSAWQFWVCTYDPPGNFVGQRPY
ncbi:CAP domain-containing protein [Sorangium sp. So ce128]|uniref:CAP domain-containing protein n=1 Tax=Sorangium sp. So ce128 TaxID=3133281 RepID=UPI003F6351C1